MTRGSATQTLIEAYDNAQAVSRHMAASGHLVAGLVSPTLPWELFRAAGYAPLLLRPGSGETDDERLEAAVFGPRIRTLFAETLRGQWQHLRLLALSRSAEADYKLHLYLREARRQGSQVPPLLFFDILHSASDLARQYGLARMRDLRAQLAALQGVGIDDASLIDAIAESNAARQGAHALQALRESTPRISGGLALRLLGAFQILPRHEYADLVAEALAELREEPRITGPRARLFGAAADTPRLHDAVDELGGVIVHEAGPWGACGAGELVRGSGDPVENLFEHYRMLPGPRSPWRAEDHSIAPTNIDVGIVLLPPDDSVEGWRAPTTVAQLHTHGIPSFVLRADASQPLSEECKADLRRFLATASGTRA